MRTVAKRWTFISKVVPPARPVLGEVERGMALAEVALR
jgi:hypothetical protein